MSTKYSKEVLEEAVAASLSYAGVLRHLNLRQAGGTQSWISGRIKAYEIDTSHFQLQAHNKGKASPRRKTIDEICVLLPEGSFRPKVQQLRRAMIESGLDELCSECYTDKSWNGKPLTLEVDHVDGIWLNNKIENLRFICPNCHSQQETNKSWKNGPLAKRYTRST